jgi:cell division protein FtsB
MPLPNQLSGTAALTSTALSADGTTIVQTFTQNLTQAQLTMALAQAQNQLAQLTAQIANINANIANLQGQLALFPVQATQ